MEPSWRRLERSLGLGDATVIGIGSMVGAGVFAVWSAAAAVAGSQLLIGLLIAGVVATCNGLSSGLLAAIHPEAGGTYIYASKQLGPVRGFIAGWGFVIGKTASCAAIALTAGAYLLPAYDRLVAVVALIVVTSINIGGLERTVRVTRILLAVTGFALVFVIASGWVAANPDTTRLTIGSSESLVASSYGILQAAGIVFFAFAGYARIATLGEEVRDPERTIPRAILISLGIVVLLYVLLGATVVSVVPSETLMGTTDPLRLVVESGSWEAFGPLIRIAAGVAACGALLNLIPGVSRTSLAMARRGDLPRIFAHLTAQPPKPVRAELTVTAAAIVLVLCFDIRDSIGISGVGVLVYYALTNWSVLTLNPAPMPRLRAIVGLAGCSILVVCLPGWALVTGSSVLVTGLVLRILFHDSTKDR